MHQNLVNEEGDHLDDTSSNPGPVAIIGMHVHSKSHGSGKSEFLHKLNI